MCSASIANLSTRYGGPGPHRILWTTKASSKLGEKHKHKSPIGSAYKAWAARNVLQFELEEHDKENSALDIRVRQTKTNFTPIDPFGVRFTFKEKKVSIEPFELEDTELVEEESIPVRERILSALRAGPATNAELQDVTGRRSVRSATISRNSYRRTL
jgi:hypothetical protein